MSSVVFRRTFWVGLLLAGLVPIGVEGGGPPGDGRDAAWNLPPDVRLDRTPDAQARYDEPSAVAFDGETLVVAFRHGKRLVKLSRDGRELASLDLPAPPEDVIVRADVRRAVVACSAPQSRLIEIDLERFSIVRETAVGHTAVAVCYSPRHDAYFVANRFNGDVSVVDGTTFRETARLPAAREPVDVCLAAGDTVLAVANHLPTDPADRFAITSVVTLWSLGEDRFEGHRLDDPNRRCDVRLPDGSTALGGIAVSPDGKYVAVSHVLSNYQLVPSNLDGGWTNSNAVTLIDVGNRSMYTTLKLDELYRGAANPQDLCWTPDGRFLLVVCEGTHELMLIDMAGLRRSFRVNPPRPLPGGTPHDPGLLPGYRRRIALPGRGAWRLACNDAYAYVCERFTDTLAEVALPDSPGGDVAVRRIRLGEPPVWSAARWGEYLFHDASTCYQNWQSCASCHPDGRADGLNWDLTNDGVGNPKNTKSLLLSHATPPAMASGVRKTAEDAVRAGFEHILFARRPEAEMKAVDAYLRSLQPVPSPHLIEGELSPAARRGRRLFESERTGCAVCHPAPLFTDRRMHDVHSARPQDHRRAFDTPTLIETWRTAPYLHDGRYTTLRALLIDGKHGAPIADLSELSDEELDALLEYVLSL
ncbi:MAG: hypothetical protein D6741_07335 [Planctomycetota bacterium]|nr:MAG: hypothetical protein D6741_07335 [Planctomycetota bacterium]